MTKAAAPRRFILLLAFALAAVPAVAAESVLYRFQGGADGANPAADLGAVFKLAPPLPPAAGWEKRTLYSFGDGADGRNPYATLVVDSAGALYGRPRRPGAGQRF